jgi:shikimate kinase
MKFPLFLIGFMGSGKSRLGRKLARKLAVEFIDLDGWIEASSGQTIPQLFAGRGERYFRELEVQALKEIGSSGEKVIALGGGTPCQQGSMEWINSKGTSLFLNVKVDTIIGRLKQNRDSRPLLQQLSPEELPGCIRRLHTERLPYYRQAQIIVSKDNPTPADLLAALNY